MAALIGLSRVHATAREVELRDSGRALELSERVVRLTGGSEPEALRALALSYESLGDTSRSRFWGERALRLARDRGMAALIETINLDLGRLDAREAAEPASDPER